MCPPIESPLGLKKRGSCMRQNGGFRTQFWDFPRVCLRKKAILVLNLKKTSTKRAFCQNMKNTCQICSAWWDEKEHVCVQPDLKVFQLSIQLDWFLRKILNVVFIIIDVVIFLFNNCQDLVTNSIKLCWLFTIMDRCKKVRFQQTHNWGLRQLFFTVSWDHRA